MKTKTKPFVYQAVGVWKIRRFKGRAYVGDDMGLGKSFQALLYAGIFIDHGPFVIVCPAGLKYNWANEVSKHLGMHSVILEKRKPPPDVHKMMQDGKNTIFIINYDILGHPRSFTPTWTDFLISVNPTLIVGDEAHYLCNDRAKRTKNFRALQDGVPNLIFLSGTPMKSNPFELWPTLNMLQPKLFPSAKRFINRFCLIERTKYWGDKIVGGKNLEKLNRLLKETVMIRRLKKDVMKDLPDKQRTITYVELPNMKEYLEAEKDLIAWLRKTSPQRANRARNSERMLRMIYLKQLIGKLKIPLIKEWIDEFSHSGEKLIVFGTHKDVLRPLHAHYVKIATRVDGSVTKMKRQAALDRFLKRKNCQLLFGNMKAAGIGWSALGVSNTLVTELAWRWVDHTQAEDRTHGEGRGKKGVKSQFFYLIAKNTIEEKLLKVLTEHYRIVESAMDGKHEEKQSEIYDLLELALLGDKHGRPKVPKRNRHDLHAERVPNTKGSVSRQMRRKR